jgi:hypothetical protein
MISIDSVTAPALEADDEIWSSTPPKEGKQVVELMIKMKINPEIATRNTMRKQPFNAVLQWSRKFYAVNGIEVHQEIVPCQRLLIM